MSWLRKQDITKFNPVGSRWLCDSLASGLSSLGPEFVESPALPVDEEVVEGHGVAHGFGSRCEGKEADVG